MKAPKEFETVRGLYDSVTDKTRPFLARCSEAKYLAVTDFRKAADQYLDLARRTLGDPKDRMTSPTRCTPQYEAVSKALESGELGLELMIALQGLKDAYVNDILKPAMRKYMTSLESADRVERLYENALQIDGLLEVLEFLRKIQKQ